MSVFHGGRKTVTTSTSGCPAAADAARMSARIASIAGQPV
jgi:hypothetical protein